MQRFVSLTIVVVDFIITIRCVVVCVHPLFNYTVDTSLSVLDYSEPALVGTTVSFNCSQPEEKLIGPNSTQCMEDGRWAPDPFELISCKGNYTPTRACSIHYYWLGRLHLFKCRHQYLIVLSFGHILRFMLLQLQVLGQG